MNKVRLGIGIFKLMKEENEEKVSELYVDQSIQSFA